MGMADQPRLHALKKTPLYDWHVRHGARMVDFGGWSMPVQYTSILEEHQAVRTGVGLFDVSHMGEVEITGPEALAVVQRLVTNDASRLEVNQALYTPMCRADGGIIDDLLVYRLAEEHYLLVVNAANTEKDVEWIRRAAADFPGARVEHTSSRWAQIAIQGPKAEAVLAGCTDFPLGVIRFYWFRSRVPVAGVPSLVSRTGYTGEDGFEVYCPAEQAVRVWEALMEAGEADGIQPAGLGARDTLRFEAGLGLYGNDMTEKTNPYETRLARFVRLEKGDFIGREALSRVKEEGPRRRLVGLEMLERGIPRHGYPIIARGENVGEITSGTFSPTLEKNLGMALIKSDLAQEGNEVAVRIRGRDLRARITKLPFYKREA